MASTSQKPDLTLGQLLDRAIEQHEQVTSAPSTNDPTIQNAILSALSDLTLCASLIRRLGIFTPNETLEDVNTKDLRCFAVDALRGDLEVQRKTSGGVERKARLDDAKTRYTDFISLLDSYSLIPPKDRQLFAGPSSTNQNPMMRREVKIAQFKLEKELKGQLAELRRRRQARPSKVTTVGTDASSSSSSAGRNAEEMEDSDSDAEESSDSRPFYLAWLKSLYLHSHQELSSLTAELEMLSHGMQMSDLPSPAPTRSSDGRAPTTESGEGDEDLSWRLDRLGTGKGLRDASGPLVSPSGKVLRPFTILPSSSRSATRLRLQSEVFRPDWTLPTMTIDEYLDQQQAQGNFLSGGGPGQEERETEGERKRREAEDDNVAGEEREEELRREKVKWDEWTDVHRKGEGNMMNRG